MEATTYATRINDPRDGWKTVGCAGAKGLTLESPSRMLAERRGLVINELTGTPRRIMVLELTPHVFTVTEA